MKKLTLLIGALAIAGLSVLVGGQSNSNFYNATSILGVSIPAFPTSGTGCLLYTYSTNAFTWSGSCGGGGGLSGMTAGQLPVAATASTVTSSIAYATTATASTIVERDSSNNINATTFTGALTGTASGNLTSSSTLDATKLSGSVPAASLISANMPPPTAIVSSGTVAAITTQNTYVTCTTTCNVTPLQPALGVQLCVRNAPGSATVITLNALSTGNGYSPQGYYEKTDNSAWGTLAHAVVSGGVATDKICLVGYDTSHYEVWTYNGTWTD